MALRQRSRRKRIVHGALDRLHPRTPHRISVEWGEQVLDRRWDVMA
jgi:hypothetical protein